MSLIYCANAGSCASNRTFGERCMHVLCRENVVSLTAISSDRWFHRAKDSIAHFFFRTVVRKVILGDSKANSFHSISYGRQEEVVVVTACFVTPKTHLGSLGVSPFLQPPVCFQWLSRLHTSPAGRNQRYSHIPIFPYSHIPIFPFLVMTVDMCQLRPRFPNQSDCFSRYLIWRNFMAQFIIRITDMSSGDLSASCLASSWFIERRITWAFHSKMSGLPGLDPSHKHFPLTSDDFEDANWYHCHSCLGLYIL